MIKVPRMSDRYRVKIGKDVTFWIAPLSRRQKLEISSCTKNRGGDMVPDLFEMQCLYLKYGLKKVEGVNYSDGSSFELQFENNELTEESLDEVLNIPQKQELMVVAWQFLNGSPDEIVDPVTNKKLKGVSVEIEAGKPRGE
jgi:hypothetical protein